MYSGANRDSIPGKYLKFMPKNPAKNDIGIKIVVIIVKTFITEFVLLLMLER